MLHIGQCPRRRVFRKKKGPTRKAKPDEEAFFLAKSPTMKGVARHKPQAGNYKATKHFWMRSNKTCKAIEHFWMKNP